ncbi:axial regulator YABBY 5-like isoform X2 [Prosopis cineraria]|uniref:axial regulator YABBY 5-like isoform X2 n=1 Tax=Prosopis cineraria TaxID=364024 RepID=UPI00240F7526|nr:axial regulator YABBY 5-like isoform X2 [Prosopis cineraria]
MSSCSNMDVASEQLCYIPCKFCNIVLAVSVPCSSLFDIVTVRCGHCTNLWSVNMAAAFQSLSWQQVQASGTSNPEYRIETDSSSICNNRIAVRAPTTRIATEEMPVNRPPEKRQRVPSAYNQFIKSLLTYMQRRDSEDQSQQPRYQSQGSIQYSCKELGTFPSYSFRLDAGGQ